MTQRFRIGIVGCGRISNAHAQAILACPSAELSALVDSSAERAQALATRIGATPTLTTDLESVLPSLDGVVIATPNHTHADLAIRCLERNIATLIEKPLAVSTAEGERICQAAERAGACLAVGYVTRFRENVQLMARLLRSGRFGTVRRFAYQFGSRGGWAPVSGYNLDRAATGGGVLVVTGTHFLDRMLDWFGYPTSAALLDDSEGGPEANAVATFSFAGAGTPVRGVARFSKSVALDGGIVIETDQGIVLMKDRPDAHITFRPAADPGVDEVIVPRAPTRGHRGGSEFLLQIEDFVDAARRRRPPLVSGREGLQSMRLIEELYHHRQALNGAAAGGGVR